MSECAEQTQQVMFIRQGKSMAKTAEREHFRYLVKKYSDRLTDGGCDLQLAKALGRQIGRAHV